MINENTIKNGDLIVVSDSTYGNDFGKAIVINNDYKGFPNAYGYIVEFIDRAGHVGFVHPTSCELVKVLPPERFNKYPAIELHKEIDFKERLRKKVDEYENKKRKNSKAYEYYTTSSDIFRTQSFRIDESQTPVPGAILMAQEQRDEFVEMASETLLRQWRGGTN